MSTRSLALGDVRIHDSFWSPRQETVRTSTLPAELEQLRTVGQLDALRLTWRPGDAPTPHIFWDSDVAKWIEAASYSQAVHPDPTLEREVDDVIELLAGAQQLERLVLPRAAQVRVLDAAPDPVLRIVRLSADARTVSRDGWGEPLYGDQPPAEQPTALTAVPYFSWDNRTPGGMRVWMREAP